ncbi:hypothetical protein KBZ21_40450, partial [Streptomyces sp. A73]|nr:hypothetical protein [Streptomyces sp. A73]
QRYILGASESAFQDAEGNTKSAWETYIGRVLALERDEDGQVPLVGPPPAEKTESSLRWATKDVWPREREQATPAQLEPLDVR